MNRSCYLLLITLFVTLSTSGCANFNTAYRDFAIDDGSGAMVDIKQRAILASTRSDDKTVVCAEPSPDALSTYAAELAAEATVPEVASASLAAALQESAGFVGLRTQSIQLLRDELYRLCEAYMNEAISAQQYDILMRRNQKYMVALLGIEQLTSAVRAPTVVIGTEGAAQASRSLSSLREELRLVNEDIEKLNAEKTSADTTAERKEQIDREIKGLEEDKRYLEQGVQNARGVAASGKAGIVEINYGEQSTQPTNTTQQEAVETIESIVLEIVKTDDIGQLCILQLSKAEEGPLTDACVTFINHANRKMQLVDIAVEKWLSGEIGAEGLEQVVEVAASSPMQFGFPNVALAKRVVP